MSQQNLRSLLSVGRERVLAILFMDASRWWYRSELARQLDATPSSLQKPLSALLNSGLLIIRKDGNRLYYRANAESPLFEDLRSILAKTSGLIDVLREAFSPYLSTMDCAFVYGSVARSEATASSDVDVMVVGGVTLSELAPALHEAERRLGREVNASLHTRLEFRRKLQAGEHFLSAIMGKPKLFIIGTQDELAAIAGSGPDRA